MTPGAAAIALDPARYFGRVEGSPTLVHVEEIGSTSDLAARLAADGAPEGTVVVADAQTAGRGRLGRAWSSPAGAGLYTSVLLRPRGPDDDAAAGVLALAVGAGLASGLRTLTGTSVEVKWPNDLVVRGRSPARAACDDRAGSRLRKVGGVLVEAATVGRSISHVVVGIGINLSPVAYPPELAARAAALTHAGGSPVDRTEVLDVVLRAVAEAAADLRGGRTSLVLERARTLAPTAVGTRVAWEHDGRRRSGVTRGIDADGALLVACGTRVHRLLSATLDWDA